MWQTIQSFFFGIPNRIRGERGNRTQAILRHDGPWESPQRVPVVALVVGERDRQILAERSAQQLLDLHFVRSAEDLWNVANRLRAPVIVFDRDWPGTEWRAVIQNLAALPQRACVVLMSGVAEEYLWEELVRCGGYDTLTKPLRAEEAGRALKLALSYWKLASSAIAHQSQPWA